MESDEGESVTDYLLGATKISLSMLQQLSGLIPVPWVGTAVNAACQLITIVEVGSYDAFHGRTALSTTIQSVQSNVTGAAQLIAQVKAVMLVVVTSLQGKNQNNVAGDLKRNIEQLTGSVKFISIRMNS